MMKFIIISRHTDGVEIPENDKVLTECKSLLTQIRY